MSLLDGKRIPWRRPTIWEFIEIILSLVLAASVAMFVAVLAVCVVMGLYALGLGWTLAIIGFVVFLYLIAGVVVEVDVWLNRRGQK